VVLKTNHGAFLFWAVNAFTMETVVLVDCSMSYFIHAWTILGCWSHLNNHVKGYEYGHFNHWWISH